MGYLFASSGGGIFVSSVVSERVYDPVFDTPMDASSIYNLLPSFYKDLMDDKEIFSTYWSGVLQQTAADLLNLWQIDYAKSLRDVPVFSQRKWVEMNLVREYDFSLDPGLTFSGSGENFYTWESPTLSGNYANRARFGVAYYDLRRPVSEKASLYFSVDVRVTSSEKYSAGLWGYFQQLPSGRLANFFGLALLNSESDPDRPRPCLLFVDGSGSPTVSIPTYVMSLGEDYRLNFDYTSGTSAVVLNVVQLRYLRRSANSGQTVGELNELQTSFFTDPTTNFSLLGVLPGDVLLAFEEEYEIVSVDGSTLSISRQLLPVDVENIAYEIKGPQLVSSSTLDLEGDAPDPFFQASRFGTGNLDMRSAALSMFSNLAALRGKSMAAQSWNWRFLDPSFSETVLSIPRIQDQITNPTALLTEGTDYRVVESTILFQEPPEEGLWAEYVAFDEQYIQNNFGTNVGLLGDSSEQYKARVRGLYYAYWQGPTIAAVRQGVHILVGLPIAEAGGVVDSINTSFSGVVGVVTVGGTDYFYPLASGTSLTVGDSVNAFDPLCDGVEVVDYVSSPEWFVDLDFNELKKFHTFAVRLNVDVFSLDTLQLASTFLDQIKPTWKDYLLIVYKNLQDDIDNIDDLLLKVTLKLYDQPCDEIHVVYDGAEYGGDEADWKYDQGIVQWTQTSAAMRETSTPLIGVAQLTNGSSAVTGVGTNWLASIGVGAVTDKFIAAAKFSAGAALETTAGSNDLYDPLGGFTDIEVGDRITITGEGDFEVITVVDASNITVDGPLTTTATSVTWYNVGKLKRWVQVTNVASNTSMTVGAVYPLATGRFVFALLDNDYKTIFYDSFTEQCPDESFEINITYTGASPPVGPVSVPAASGSTTYTFTSTGDTYSVTLSELIP